MKLPEKFTLQDGKLFYNKKDIGKCHLEVDGYYVFWPDEDGYFESWVLKDIARCLDILNEEIEKRLREQLYCHHEGKYTLREDGTCCKCGLPLKPQTTRQ